MKGKLKRGQLLVFSGILVVCLFAVIFVSGIVWSGDEVGGSNPSLNGLPPSHHHGVTKPIEDI